VLPLLRKAAPSRVINVASRAAEAGAFNASDVRRSAHPYEVGFGLYAQSKLANVLHARKLAQLYGKDGITAVSLHPGTIVTGKC